MKDWVYIINFYSVPTEDEERILKLFWSLVLLLAAENKIRVDGSCFPGVGKVNLTDKGAL